MLFNASPAAFKKLGLEQLSPLNIEVTSVSGHLEEISGNGRGDSNRYTDEVRRANIGRVLPDWMPYTAGIKENKSAVCGKSPWNF